MSNKNNIRYMDLVKVVGEGSDYNGYKGRVQGVKGEYITVKLFIDESIHNYHYTILEVVK